MMGKKRHGWVIEMLAESMQSTGHYYTDKVQHRYATGDLTLAFVTDTRRHAREMSGRDETVRKVELNLDGVPIQVIKRDHSLIAPRSLSARATRAIGQYS
jgi:hypothetical protein